MAAEWSRVKEVLAGALELHKSARGAFIAEACRGDQALRERVELLLASEADAESAFSGPASDAVDAPELPARLGRYAIRRMIAAGGMGVVYEGEQESPQRRVAIKVAHGVLTRSGVARFRQEGEIL